MIYITKKMYKAFGKFVNNYEDLKGVNPIFNKINISKDYPLDNDTIGSLEHAGSIHKEVRRFLQPYLRPGTKIVDIAKLIELKTTELSKQDKTINKGIGFPVGISINECAAHFHPLSNDETKFKKDDIIKIDYGIEVNKWIIDSAFTICFDYKYENLMTAVKEATENGIKNIAVDMDINDWATSNQEVMESYEIVLDGKTLPIKAISNLGGHNIVKGIIHGGIFLPVVNMKDKLPKNYKFREGIYAIETFGSTSDNKVEEIGESTLYRINPEKQSEITKIRLETTKKVYNKIKHNFLTLPFTDRYMDKLEIPNYKSHLKILTNNELLYSYPPLCVTNGGYTAQYEHTVYIGDNKKIVFSRGEDY